MRILKKSTGQRIINVPEERRRGYIVLFASANIIHEFRVYDGALCPSSNAVRNIEVFLPLSLSFSLFLPLYYQSRSLRQPYASSARITTRAPERNMAEAGFIIFIQAIFKSYGMYSAQCLKELTSLRPIFRRISIPPPGQEEDPSIEGRSCRRAPWYADPTKGCFVSTTRT